ncbi:unnamed protein product, partial [Ectocarpus fasciculatus]
PSFAVVAYLPEWRYHSANYDNLCNYTTHLLFFSVEPNGEGDIVGMDRFPDPGVLMDARQAAETYGCKLMICLGGNGRSSGFSKAVSSEKSRKHFVKNIAKMIKRYRFDGVDINWEYPGYAFGRGYGPEVEIKNDYAGLIETLSLLRKRLGPEKTISLAYYPDARQEKMLLDGGAEQHINFMHMMTYDQSSGHHSTMELATKSVAQALDTGLSAKVLTLGLPFYGRHSATGDWTTYEDIVQKAHPLPKDVDHALKDHRGFVGFNGAATITKKLKHAIEEHLGGVMIWEAGQDCRQNSVNRYGTEHGVTCPEGKESSLLFAMSQVL